MKSVDDRKTLCGMPVLNRRCVDVVFYICVSFTSLDVVCNERIGDVRYVGVYWFVHEVMYIHSVKCLVTVILRAGGCFWLKTGFNQMQPPARRMFIIIVELLLNVFVMSRCGECLLMNVIVLFCVGYAFNCLAHAGMVFYR